MKPKKTDNLEETIDENPKPKAKVEQRKYYFPEEEVCIEADSHEEAVDKLK